MILKEKYSLYPHSRNVRWIWKLSRRAISVKKGQCSDSLLALKVKPSHKFRENKFKNWEVPKNACIM